MFEKYWFKYNLIYNKFTPNNSIDENFALDNDLINSNQLIL